MEICDQICAPNGIDCNGDEPADNCGENVCDGLGDDAGECGDEDELCENWRSDPVHVGTGAFVLEPRVDVRYAGTDMPIEFVRRYTSRDAWRPGRMPNQRSTRLARGWSTRSTRLCALLTPRRPLLRW